MCPFPHKRATGFTLIEILVALAVASILAAIAWPGYRQVMYRSQRLEARLALMKLQYLQERHFADHHAYAAELRTDGSSGTLPVSSITESGNYELLMSIDADGQGYEAIAHARGSGRQAGDQQCQRFSINTVGVRRSAAADGQWRAEPGTGCWG